MNPERILDVTWSTEGMWSRGRCQDNRWLGMSLASGRVLTFERGRLTLAVHYKSCLYEQQADTPTWPLSQHSGALCDPTCSTSNSDHIQMGLSVTDTEEKTKMSKN